MSAKRVPHSEPVFIYDDAELNQLINKSLDDNQAAEFSLPYGWSETGDGIGGPSVDDPLAIDFALPSLSRKLDVGPVWRGSLGSMVDDLIDMHEDPTTGKAETPEAKAILSSVSKRLRELADQIDSKISGEDAANGKN